jgi:hypothetical protein
MDLIYCKLQSWRKSDSAYRRFFNAFAPLLDEGIYNAERL